MSIFGVLLYFLMFFIVLKTNAATEASVAATVTAQNISVGVSDGVVSYLTMSVGTSKNTTITGVNDSQKATNDGNITESFNLRGMNSTSAGIGWTLSAAPGVNTYAHEYCVNNCDASPTWIPLTTNNSTGSTNVGVGSTQWFDFQLKTPTSTTDYNQQTVNVTVQAVSFP